MILNYLNFLKTHKIIVDHKEREEIILKKISAFSQSKQYKETLNPKLLEEVVNIVEDPNLLHVSFSKDYLKNVIIPLVIHLVNKREDKTLKFYISGGQGSGKTTLSIVLQYFLENFLKIIFLVKGKINKNPIRSVKNPGIISNKAAKAIPAPDKIS